MQATHISYLLLITFSFRAWKWKSYKNDEPHQSGHSFIIYIHIDLLILKRENRSRSISRSFLALEVRAKMKISGHEGGRNKWKIKMHRDRSAAAF
jgi:hypothetical protein